MGYERYPRGTNPQGDFYNRSDAQDYGRDYGSGRDYSYSSARDYAASGRWGDHDDGRERDGDRYGRREYGHQRYDQRDRLGSGQRQGGSYGSGGYDGRQEHGDRYGAPARSSEYRGSYAHDGRRFEDVSRYRQAGDDGRQGGGYGRQPQGYDYEDRGFFQRAGDEVRSWFGDDDAERRREADARYDERYYAGRHDDDYHGWRQGQIAALDRDYDEYRRENRSRFEKEFSTWRTTRQGQRDLLTKVNEHQEVVGSDGTHVGTVDKVRGDRIVLTKNDTDAGGQHHSIPSSWITSVDDKVTLSKSGAEAKQAWRDEERNTAMFAQRDDRHDERSSSGGNLNRSFSGTY